jgi:hypothetical protein
MSVDRLAMPQEFFDRTSAQLLLKPEPQYLYAQMLMNALSAELPIPDAMGHPGRELSGVGTDYSNAGGNFRLQADGISELVFAATVDFKGEPGSTIRFNRPTFANSTYTQASRAVAKGQTISTEPINIGSEQNAMTIGRFAGPYDQANGRIAPYALDSLDTQMGVHKASKIVGTHLSRDWHKFNDSVMTAIADTGTDLFPSGYSATTDFNSAGCAPMSYAYLSHIEAVMDTDNLPTFGDGFRMIVIPPAGDEALKLDRQYARLSEFHKEKNALFPGTYLRSVGKLHVFKSTTLTATAGSGSIPLYRCHAISPGSFGVGMGSPPKTAYSNDDNYGIAAKIIWIANMAYTMFDNTFVRKCYCTSPVA